MNAIRNLALCLCLLIPLASPAAAVTRKAVSKAVEAAAKRSGKALTPALRKSAEKALAKAAKQYGDDVLKAVMHGGLEALEQGGKHGKYFWKLCKISPKAARTLALHADDLMPLARRIGPAVIHLETRVPGLARQAVMNFGDDAVRVLAKIPPDDAAKLIKYASRADSPATRKLLFECSKKTNGTILRHLDGKRIVALGLSAAMVTAAYKVSNGVENGIETVARESPETFTRTIAWPMTAITILASIVLLVLLALILKWAWTKWHTTASLT